MKKIMMSVVIPIGPNRKMEALPYLESQTIPVETIVEMGQNPSANRNKGAGRAKGEIIAFVNSHSILPKDWAEKIIVFFENHKEIDIAGGPQLTPPGSSLFARASGYCLSSVFSTAHTTKRYKGGKTNFNASERHLTSANLACRRKVFEKVRFDDKLWPGEDPKFIIDSKKEGFGISYNPDIYIFHRRRETFRDLSNQIMHYAMMRSKHLKGSVLKNPLFLVPGIFVSYLVLLPLFYIFFIPEPGFFYWLFLFPLVLHVILNIIFSAYESLRNRDAPAMLLAPLIFFIIQISYGLGFMRGLIANFSKNGT